MITVGKYTYGTDNLQIKSWGQSININIGSFCSIGGNVSIFVGGNHNTNWFTTYPFGHIHTKIFNRFDGSGHPKIAEDIIIGNDVWIGGNSTIMSGVKIGDGACIAANSHVVDNIDSYSIVGGNPSKLIKYRFDYEMIEYLLELKWWDLPDEIINQLSPFLCSNDFDGLFKEVKKLKI